jgi:hypothetical protein
MKRERHPIDFDRDTATTFVSPSANLDPDDFGAEAR